MIDISRFFQQANPNIYDEEEILNYLQSIDYDNTINDELPSFEDGNPVVDVSRGYDEYPNQGYPNGYSDNRVVPIDESIQGATPYMNVDPGVNAAKFYGGVDPQTTPVGFKSTYGSRYGGDDYSVANRPITEGDLTPIPQISSRGIIIGGQEYDSDGNPVTVNQQKTSSPQSPEVSDSNDFTSVGKFVDAFKAARAKLGANGVFTYNGKKYSTQYATERASAGTNRRASGNKGVSSSSSSSSGKSNDIPSKGGSSGTSDIRQVVAAGLSKLTPDVKTERKKIADGFSRVTSMGGELREYNPRTGRFRVGGREYTKDRLQAVNRELQKYVDNFPGNGDMEDKRKAMEAIRGNNQLINSAQREKNKLKISDMKAQGESIIFNGKRYDMTNKDHYKELSKLVYDSESGIFSRTGQDKLEAISRGIYNKATPERRKSLFFYEGGGNIPYLAYGDEIVTVIGPTGQKLQISREEAEKNGYQIEEGIESLPGISTPRAEEINSAITNSGIGVSPYSYGQMSTTPNVNPGASYKVWDESNNTLRDYDPNKDNLSNYNNIPLTSPVTGQYIDANGKVSSLNIQASSDNPIYMSSNLNNQFYSDNSRTLRANNEIKDKLTAQENRMNIFNTLTGNTDFSVEDALYKVGESAAYNPSDDVFKDRDGNVNKTAKGVASGFNILKGVAASGKAILGGARDVMSGYANQTRNDLIKNEYKRRQLQALKNQNMISAEEGIEVPFFNDGEYLKFLEDGTGQEYSDMGPQDYREQIPVEQEMTGEYLQQQPPEVGAVPNAEVERGEYVRDPQGQVQEVVGRSHKQGGERVELEPSTIVISDKLKIGAKNAKAIRDKYGIKVNASDTYATAVDRFTKKIGLSELNSQQESYFNKLKKDADTKDQETSELNTQYLSDKISGIENKKALLEGLRSGFTDFVFTLQQDSKKPRVEGNFRSPSSESFAVGGVVSYEKGDEVKGMTPDEYVEYLSKSINLPDYDFKDIPNTRKRFESVAKQYGLDTSKYDLNTMEGLNALAGDLQNSVRDTHKGITNHYSLNVAPTQKGLQYALDNGLISTKELNSLGVATSKGKVLIGSMSKISKDNSAKLSEIIRTNGEKEGMSDKLSGYVENNFNDGKAYYRFPELNTISFDSEDARDKFFKEKGYTEVEDNNGNKIYYAGKEGQYVNSIVNAPEQATVEEASTNDNKQSPIAPYMPGLPSSYSRPVLPDMSLEYPRPMEDQMKAQHRYNYLDPVALSPDDQLTELYRQSDAAVTQFDGLTDTQRAAAVSNLTANTQDNAAKVISGINAANAQERQRINAYNAGIMDREEDARVNDALQYEQAIQTAKALTDQDYDDYMDKNREIRIKRFNYLTKDKQINDMVEHFKTDSNGNIVLDEGQSSLLYGILSDPTLTEKEKVEKANKVVKTNSYKVSNDGKATTVSNSITKSGK